MILNILIIQLKVTMRKTTETALINNKIKEIYENSHLCFQQAKLNELKSEDIMFIMIA